MSHLSIAGDSLQWAVVPAINEAIARLVWASVPLIMMIDVCSFDLYLGVGSQIDSNEIAEDYGDVKDDHEAEKISYLYVSYYGDLSRSSDWLNRTWVLGRSGSARFKP